jgi:hypothetical protein
MSSFVARVMPQVGQGMPNNITLKQTESNIISIIINEMILNTAPSQYFFAN